MGFARHLLFFAVLGLTASISTTVFAQTECPIESVLEIENITTTAQSVWNSRWASRRKTLAAGRDVAQDAAPGRVHGLNLSLTPEFSMDGGSESHEYMGAATIAVELGNLAAARKTAIGAEWQAMDDALVIERWTFVDEVQNAYLLWRSNELERGHLEAYFAEANAELDPIRAARDRQLISRLDLADLEAEVAWIRAELADATRSAKLARSRLEALLGVRCELAAVPAIHNEPDKENPWKPLVAQAESFPEVKAYRSRREALEARATANDAANPMILELGVGARTVGFDANFLGPVLAITLPFQRTEAADAALARAQAQAEASAGEWAAVRIRAELDAEAANFDVLVQEYFNLREGYVAPLEARAELMHEAFKASQVQVDRLIRARRELHEAEHKLILHRADIDARRLKASAIQKLLTPSGNTGEIP